MASMNPTKITKSLVKPFLQRRSPDSHKGQNGRILIIGGSEEFHGAPILSALAALHTGADLVHLLVPACNYDITRTYSPDLIVHKYRSSHFNLSASNQALKLKSKTDVILIGPGIGNMRETTQAIRNLVMKHPGPLVLDAQAIPPLKTILPKIHQKQITITPHLAEFNKIAGTKLTSKDPQKLHLQAVTKLAKEHSLSILSKSPTDIIASHTGKISFNYTGNPGMTVGGTGDVLSGMITSFIAQGISRYNACQAAAFINGYAADQLSKTHGLNFTASDLIKQLPKAIQQISPWKK